MEAITESLVKTAVEIEEYAANQQADTGHGMGKSDYPSSKPTDSDAQHISESAGKNSGAPKSNSLSESGNTSNNQNSGAGTMQTTVPVLPCEQVEVVNLDCFEPAQLPQKEILKARWLNDKDVEIKSSLTERNVKIQVETNGFPDGEKLKIQILDSKNKLVKNLKLTINGNKATSDTFNLEDEWIGKVLFISFES